MRSLLNRALGTIADVLADKLQERLPARAPLILPSDRSATRGLAPLRAIHRFAETIEWEPLASPVYAHVVSAAGAEGFFGTIVVQRDAEYRLSVTFNASDAAAWAEPQLSGTPGSLNPGTELRCRT